ncbi:MAG TPA: IclR family transcriptional regulator [Deinococcales bacterium]|nr:IclR family transcriptional regulator [Deinococcales bacterium]
MRAVERALQLIEVVAKSRTPLSVTDIARALDLAPSTIHRLLQTLGAQGYVMQYEDSKRYGVGRGMSEIGRAMLLRHDLAQRSRPHLEKLAEQSGETANLAALYGTSVIYLAQVESSSLIRVSGGLGYAAPLHASAVGKVYLADFNDEMLADVITIAGLEAYTANTIRDMEALRKELALIRERGYAVDDEEREPGVRCIAAPVRGSSGMVVSAVSISGLASRVTPERVPELAAVVALTAARLSSGFRER